jgi:1-phosphofructokinase family hexose kinase
MILCVTFNPAIDRTMVVPDFAKGGVFRPRQTVVAPGGKGVNVARAVRILGGEPLCAGFLGGFSGRFFENMLREEGLQGRWTWLTDGEMRTCVILADPDRGFTTVINEPGPSVVAADWARLRDDVLQASAAVDFVSLSGSLPPGSPIEAFVGLVGDLVAAGKHVWVDTSGAPLQAVPRMPGVAIKVNDEEAGALTGAAIRNVADAVAAAQVVCVATGQCVLITMGGQGAILTDGRDAWHAVPPPVAIKSGVGSGDSFLAGLLAALARGESYSMALAQATAAGTANALSIGGGSFTRAEFETILRETQITLL